VDITDVRKNEDTVDKSGLPATATAIFSPQKIAVDQNIFKKCIVM
jgi:hypothetical protein